MAFSRLGWAVHLVKTFIWHQFLVSVQAQKQILRLAVLAQDDGVKLAQDDGVKLAQDDGVKLALVVGVKLSQDDGPAVCHI